MKFENLVPSLENCRKIPAGKFSDSALVWYEYLSQEWSITTRKEVYNLMTLDIISAPTIDEIAMETDGGIIVDYHSQTVESCKWECCGEPLLEYWGENSTPADAALKLWLRINNKGE